MTVSVLGLCFTVPWVGLQCVVVVFPGYTYFFHVSREYGQHFIIEFDFEETSSQFSASKVNVNVSVLWLDDFPGAVDL